MNGLRDFTAEPRRRAWALLCAALLVAATSGVVFARMHEPEPIVAGPGVTATRMLSDFAPEVGGTAADTPVYIMEGAQPGGTMVLLGGTHAQEISGLMGAVLVVENATVERGRLIVIPQSNRSGFTHTDPLEAFAHTFTIDTPNGPRWFRNGMRLSNPIHQWPDPDLFIHPQSAERLVGWEARNLNRNYPGEKTGSYTGRLGAAILGMAAAEGADLVYDMHEAYPEYPVINMMVVHERAFEIASLAQWGLQARGIPMDVQPSPRNLRGLSHREFGDHTEAHAILSETANPAMGRFRGALSERLVVDGVDDNYARAAELGRLFVPFDENGHPLKARTARNIATFEEIVVAWNELFPDRSIVLSGVPPYDALLSDGLGPFLLPEPG